jgi:hypothetical protein
MTKTLVTLKVAKTMARKAKSVHVWVPMHGPTDGVETPAGGFMHCSKSALFKAMEPVHPLTKVWVSVDEAGQFFLDGSY